MNSLLVAAAINVEMFGYGYGLAGVILPGAVSGWIQTRLCYSHFLIWVIISALPALFLSRLIPIRAETEDAPQILTEPE